MFGGSALRVLSHDIDFIRDPIRLRFIIFSKSFPLYLLIAKLAGRNQWDL
jgi:hypothetical protein